MVITLESTVLEVYSANTINHSHVGDQNQITFSCGNSLFIGKLGAMEVHQDLLHCQKTKSYWTEIENSSFGFWYNQCYVHCNISTFKSLKLHQCLRSKGGSQGALTLPPCV